MGKINSNAFDGKEGEEEKNNLTETQTDYGQNIWLNNKNINLEIIIPHENVIICKYCYSKLIIQSAVMNGRLNWTLLLCHRVKMLNYV